MGIIEMVPTDMNWGPRVPMHSVDFFWFFVFSSIFVSLFFCKKRRRRGNFVEKKEFAIHDVITYKSECFQSILKHLDKNRCIPLYFFSIFSEAAGLKKHFVINDKMKSCVSYK